MDRSERLKSSHLECNVYSCVLNQKLYTKYPYPKFTVISQIDPYVRDL